MFQKYRLLSAAKRAEAEGNIELAKKHYLEVMFAMPGSKQADEAKRAYEALPKTAINESSDRVEPPPGAGAHPTDSNASKYDKGCNKYREGKYDEARILFQEQIDDAPDSDPAKAAKLQLKFLKTTPLPWFPSWIFVAVGMLFLSVRTSRMDPSLGKSQMYIGGGPFLSLAS